MKAETLQKIKEIVSLENDEDLDEMKETMYGDYDFTDEQQIIYMTGYLNGFSHIDNIFDEGSENSEKIKKIKKAVNMNFEDYNEIREKHSRHYISEEHEEIHRSGFLDALNYISKKIEQ